MDDLFIAAAEAVSAAGYGSNGLLCDRLSLGYHRAKPRSEEQAATRPAVSYQTKFSLAMATAAC